MRLSLVHVYQSTIWDFEKNLLIAKSSNREYLNKLMIDNINSVNENMIRLIPRKGSL